MAQAPKYIDVEKIKAKILPLLQNYQKLRYITVFGIGIIGIIGIGMPIQMKIKKLEEEYAKEKRRQELIYGINLMESKLITYKKKINKNGDLNWWIEYVLNGSRKNNIKITEYQPYDPKTLDSKPGTYKGYLLRFQVEGEYTSYFNFINWIESNDWGMRIARLRIQKEQGGNKIVGNMTIAVLTVRTVKKSGEKDIKAAEKIGSVKVLDIEEMEKIEAEEHGAIKKDEVKSVDEMKEIEDEKETNGEGAKNKGETEVLPNMPEAIESPIKEY